MTQQQAPKRLSKQQRRDMLELIAAVNRDEVCSLADVDDGIPQWFLDWPVWSAEYARLCARQPIFLTERTSRGYRRARLRDGRPGYVSDYMPATLREVLCAMTTSTKETLIAARALIADPEHWTQEELAIDRTGAPVSPLSDDAYAYCALGAVARVCNGDGNDLFEGATDILHDATYMMFGMLVEDLNDSGPNDASEEEDCHRAVLAAFDAAIDKAGETP